MRKIGLLSAVLGLLMGIFTFLIFNQPSTASISSKVYINLDDMNKEISRLLQEDPELGLSSNPYSYIKNNKEYARIVQLGYSALPIIEERITEGNKFGLDKYILAIAAEEIAKVNLKKGEYRWSDAEEFVRSWKLHLQSVPGKVQQILNANESSEWKNNKLVELGAPAIPYILEDIDSGGNELVPALQKVTFSSQNDSRTGQSMNLTAKQWKDLHKEDNQIIKSLIKKAADEKEINKYFRIK
ncbi:hypothetical protein [Paenibacillus chitinolyticus]